MILAPRQAATASSPRNPALNRASEAVGSSDKLVSAGSEDLGVRLKRKVSELGASARLGELSRKQGQVEDRKQDRIANASFELALDRQASREEVESIFELIESGLSDPSVRIVNSKDLEGGMNVPKLVKLSNGLTGVWKPSEKPYTERIRENVPLGTQDERDQAAYLVDKRLGHLAKIPPTVTREFDGVQGVLTFFVGNATNTTERQAVANRFLFEAEETDDNPIALLDCVIGNLDRHRGNWLISRTEQAIPIDHDLTFPERNGTQGWANYNFHRPLKLDSENRERLQAFSQDEDLVRRELEPLIGQQAVDAMYRRVDLLLAKGESGTHWLGKTRVRRRSATRLGYLTNQNYSVGEIPGVSSRQTGALKEAGISDTETLLKEFAKPYHRAHLKTDTGHDIAHAFTTRSLHEALKKADLMRIKGIGPKSSELLLRAGVDTVPELAQRNGENLSEKLKQLAPSGPGRASVKEWIRKAKLMRRRIHY